MRDLCLGNQCDCPKQHPSKLLHEFRVARGEVVRQARSREASPARPTPVAMMGPQASLFIDWDWLCHVSKGKLLKLPEFVALLQSTYNCQFRSKTVFSSTINLKVRATYKCCERIVFR